MGLEYFRFYVYEKRVILNRIQALQPILKKNRAHKQNSARLTPWLDRPSHFDVNVQYTAGESIPLTDYLSRHPIVPNEFIEIENKATDETKQKPKKSSSLIKYTPSSNSTKSEEA